jgi:ubiquinone/menaquinone biosynthesis C-methylase UbiE
MNSAAQRRDEVWKNEWLVKRFLEGIRGGIPYASDQIEVMLRLLASGERPVERFLDLGSGSGLLAIGLLTRYPDARATLVDFSEPMMEAARDLLEDDVTMPRFVIADFAMPSWLEKVSSEAPFDAIVSGYAIHHLPDERKRALYAELLTLLAPGGFFINVEHVASATPWLSGVFNDAMIDSVAAFQQQAGLGRSRSEVAHEFHNRPDEAANVLTPVETQCQWLREIGFEDVDCWFKYFELAVFGGRKPAGPQ